MKLNNLEKLKKLDQLDKLNYHTHQKFEKALIKLLNFKFSNSGLKYLEPQFYETQTAQTTTTVEGNFIQL